MKKAHWDNLKLKAVVLLFFTLWSMLDSIGFNYKSRKQLNWLRKEITKT